MLPLKEFVTIQQTALHATCFSLETRICYITTNSTMMNISKHTWAKIAALVLAASLLAFGLYMSSLPPITLFRQWPYYLLPEPKIVMGLGVIIAILHHWAAQALLWIAAKLHRIFSSLFLLLALGADGLLHIFSIPHMEGWWLSLVGGSVVISAAYTAWLTKWKSRHNHE